MYLAPGHTSKSDVVAREVLDRPPSDVAPGPRVIGVDAAPHHPMRGTKGLPDRAGAILHEWLHDKYLACASDEDTSTWHSADGATGTPPHATPALDCLVCKGGAVTTARSTTRCPLADEANLLTNKQQPPGKLSHVVKLLIDRPASFAPHRVLRRPCATPFKPLTMGGLEVAPREAYCGPAPGVDEIHCGSVEAAPMQPGDDPAPDRAPRQAQCLRALRSRAWLGRSRRPHDGALRRFDVDPRLTRWALFMIVVGSLSVELNKTPGLHHAPFADGLALLTRSSDKVAARATVQSALWRVGHWTLERFRQRPIARSHLEVDRCSCLLALHLQPMPRTGRHVSEVIEAATAGLARLRVVCWRKCGRSAALLCSCCTALLEPELLYGATVWWDRASRSCSRSLEDLHVEAAAAIVGTAMCSESRDLPEEADPLPLDSTVLLRRTRLCLSSTARGGFLVHLARQAHTPDAGAATALRQLSCGHAGIGPCGLRMHTPPSCAAAARASHGSLSLASDDKLARSATPEEPTPTAWITDLVTDDATRDGKRYLAAAAPHQRNKGAGAHETTGHHPRPAPRRRLTRTFGLLQRWVTGRVEMVCRWRAAHTQAGVVPMAQDPQLGSAPPTDKVGDGYSSPPAPVAQSPPSMPQGQYSQKPNGGPTQPVKTRPGQSVYTGNPMNAPGSRPAVYYREGPWHYSLCVCCEDMDSCCEACCCFPCQVSRQCNMFMYNRREIHWPYCLLMIVFDLYLPFSISCIFAGETRRLARERYGISGTGCEDFCIGYWCRTCSAQQVLLEMIVMNEFPGAMCFEVAPQPAANRMV
ncbi:PLAC8 family protein [Leishmania donovani]|uniref:PLAC8 family protein n=1 Tax=Leishmania donovani TaxID=5661 RepID=A0A504XB13_LEIDO|nr:PLAC8 family protein [Leishmania donovani]